LSAASDFPASSEWSAFGCGERFRLRCAARRLLAFSRQLLEQ
jgi:hypothetical protein